MEKSPVVPAHGMHVLKETLAIICPQPHQQKNEELHSVGSLSCKELKAETKACVKTSRSQRLRAISKQLSSVADVCSMLSDGQPVSKRDPLFSLAWTHTHRIRHKATKPQEKQTPHRKQHLVTTILRVNMKPIHKLAARRSKWATEYNPPPPKEYHTQ